MLVALAMNVAAFLFLAAVAITVILGVAAFLVRRPSRTPRPRVSADRGDGWLLLLSLSALALIVFSLFITIKR